MITDYYNHNKIDFILLYTQSKYEKYKERNRNRKKRIR